MIINSSPLHPSHQHRPICDLYLPMMRNMSSVAGDRQGQLNGSSKTRLISLPPHFLGLPPKTPKIVRLKTKGLFVLTFGRILQELGGNGARRRKLIRCKRWMGAKICSRFSFPAHDPFEEVCRKSVNTFCCVGFLLLLWGVFFLFFWGGAFFNFICFF